ncbi:MAG: hypothetical protein RJA22_1885 [Verrucomicrobiota bacterium]|jgi:putative exosortase-associated protein (TIGR04073 family)
MRIVLFPLAVLAAAVFTGCAGPENKLGRGLSNATEFARLGEIRRSMEQTAAWDDARMAPTTGFIRGFNRSVARTGLGLYEVVTFPFPPYGPSFASGKVYPDPSIATLRQSWGGLVLPEKTVYPANYRPGVGTDSMYEADKRLGFSSGDAFPFVPGSSFKTLSP